MVNLNSQFTEEEYLAMDPVEFRARFRQKVHRLLEMPVYRAIHGEKPLVEDAPEFLKELIHLWKRKGISTDLPDFTWGSRVLQFAEALLRGEKIDLSGYAPHPISEENLKAFEHILQERRSVRQWTDQRVPDSVIDKLLEAGLNAAHSCNLQSIRYIVVREEDEPGIVPGNIPGGPVHILILQDERVYQANLIMPIRNRLLDAGAAAQNIVLAAHALGLGGVWLTHSDAMLEKLYKRFQLPEYLKIVTYVDVGYPALTPAPVERILLDEAVLLRI